MATLFDGIGANGFSSGFAAGNSIREMKEKQARQKGLASGFTKVLNGDNTGWQEMANADPVATMNAWNTQQALKQKDAITPYQQAMLTLEREKLGAVQQKKAEEETKQKEEEQKSLNNAQLGVNTMKSIADAGNLGKGQGISSWWNDDVRYDQGRLSGAIAAVAPRAIAKLKAAGVSGVNTLGEFMTYVGLPQNATSDQIAAAVPLISQIIGAENPYSANQNGGVEQTKGSKVNMNIFSNMSDEDLLRGL